MFPKKVSYYARAARAANPVATPLCTLIIGGHWMAKSTRRTSTRKGRRKFLKTVAFGAGGLALPGQSPGAAGMGSGGPSHEESSGKAASAGKAIAYPRVFREDHRRMLAFPLGGVGAGSISLGGRGDLREWWIFNRPDKGNAPQYAFPAIWAKAAGEPAVVRVLEARYLPPYEGSSGLGSDNAPGLPRLESSVFTGEFPLARIDFEDARLPVRVALEAFTPFIPLDPDESGLPVAILRYRVTNPRRTAAQVSIAYSIENPVGARNASGRANEFRSDEHLAGLVMRNPFLPAKDPLAGTFALAVLGQGTGRFSYLRGWPAATWWQSALLFWDDF